MLVFFGVLRRKWFASGWKNERERKGQLIAVSRVTEEARGGVEKRERRQHDTQSAAKSTATIITDLHYGEDTGEGGGWGKEATRVMEAEETEDQSFFDPHNAVTPKRCGRELCEASFSEPRTGRYLLNGVFFTVEPKKFATGLAKNNLKTSLGLRSPPSN